MPLVAPNMHPIILTAQNRDDPMTNEWVLKGKNLTLGYGHWALFHDLSFDVTRGEILGDRGTERM
jgi:ABC-type sugar transport system ATPase subunit